MTAAQHSRHVLLVGRGRSRTNSMITSIKHFKTSMVNVSISGRKRISTQRSMPVRGESITTKHLAMTAFLSLQ